MIKKKQKYQIGETIRYKTGHLGIIEYSYAQAFPHFDENNVTDYTIIFLNDKGKPELESTWVYEDEIRGSVSKDYAKGLEIIRQYNKKTDPMDIPAFIDPNLREKIGL